MIARRDALRLAASLPVAALPGGVRAQSPRRVRVRPGDPEWPGQDAWGQLRRRVDGRLLALRSPLDPCLADPEGAACDRLLAGLKNPFLIGDDPALTQTCGWVDAWTAQPSAYTVAARSADDVAAAVTFARERNLRLVVRGGGHSYLGTSTAPDSLMIWTRAMDDIVLHDAFVPRGGAGLVAPTQAVTVGAGALWGHTYQAVTTVGGRYVQGGGCLTVGVAGLVQGGGFGTYSKQFGTAGSSLLEAEVVTADGVVRVANTVTNPDLFWALKGGGGGTFGVITRLTLRTWDLPALFGIARIAVRAANADAYRRLIGHFVDLYADHLSTPHWGELAELRPGLRLMIDMNAQGLDRAQLAAIWQPFFDWVSAQADLTIAGAPLVLAAPMRHRWDAAFLEAHAPGSVLHDDRPGAPAENVFWPGNRAEAGHVIHGFNSVWLPGALLDEAARPALVDALVSASQHWTIELHFQKGLAGGPDAVIAAARDTPMNPAVADAFALAIIASEGQPAFPGLRGHSPDVAKARRDVERMARATSVLRALAPHGGAYVAESDYFQPGWQDAYWGGNYPRLLAIKRRVDPDGLFFARHGVGSEGWSEDGFTPIA